MSFQAGHVCNCYFRLVIIKDFTSMCKNKNKEIYLCTYKTNLRNSHSKIGETNKPIRRRVERIGIRRTKGDIYTFFFVSWLNIKQKSVNFTPHLLQISSKPKEFPNAMACLTELLSAIVDEIQISMFFSLTLRIQITTNNNQKVDFFGKKK